jgi:NitT/TauT family transport system substrate-binding protein
VQIIQSRRDFLASASMAAAASVLGGRGALAEEGPLETTTLRLLRDTGICDAPVQIADDLLRAEGFTDIRYQPRTGPAASRDALAHGELDFMQDTAAWVVSNLDAGQPFLTLTGVHTGCYELFAHDPIRRITDLKGKRVGIPEAPGSSGHLLLAAIAAEVGLDPHDDIDWIITPSGDFMQAFVERKVDAFLGFPPQPQELRARRVGHVILNTTTDQPWSDYFCCMVLGNSGFVRAHPIATKRYLRAVLKTADLCTSEPQRVARRLVDAGFTKRYDHALEALTEIPYATWRELDPEDSLRFYALRLHEVGMIRSTPREIIAAGTDWRFLNQLKRELKA